MVGKELSEIDYPQAVFRIEQLKTDMMDINDIDFIIDNLGFVHPGDQLVESLVEIRARIAGRAKVVIS